MLADLITSDKKNPLGCERRETLNSIRDVRKITSARMLMRLEAVLFESPASRKSTPVPEKAGGGEHHNNGTIAQTDHSHHLSSARSHQLAPGEAPLLSNH